MAAKLHANGDYKDKLSVPGSISKEKFRENRLYKWMDLQYLNLL